jgi:hypothetical protein
MKTQVIKKVVIGYRVSIYILKINLQFIILIAMAALQFQLSRII